MDLGVEVEGLLPGDGDWLGVGEVLDCEGGEEGGGGVEEEDECCGFGDHLLLFC